MLFTLYFLQQRHWYLVSSSNLKRSLEGVNLKFFSFFSKTDKKWIKYSIASYYFLVENSKWPSPTNFLIMKGLIPS